VFHFNLTFLDVFGVSSSHGYFSHAYFQIVCMTKRTIEIFTLPAVGA